MMNQLEDRPTQSGVAHRKYHAIRQSAVVVGGRKIVQDLHRALEVVGGGAVTTAVN
jgi:hypothetical protein